MVSETEDWRCRRNRRFRPTRIPFGSSVCPSLVFAIVGHGFPPPFSLFLFFWECQKPAASPLTSRTRLGTTSRPLSTHHLSCHLVKKNDFENYFQQRKASAAAGSEPATISVGRRLRSIPTNRQRTNRFHYGLPQLCAKQQSTRQRRTRNAE